MYVVSVLVRRQTLALDDVDNVRRVHHEQERASMDPCRGTPNWTVDGARHGDTHVVVADQNRSRTTIGVLHVYIIQVNK